MAYSTEESKLYKRCISLIPSFREHYEEKMSEIEGLQLLFQFNSCKEFRQAYAQEILENVTHAYKSYEALLSKAMEVKPASWTLWDAFLNKAHDEFLTAISLITSFIEVDSVCPGNSPQPINEEGSAQPRYFRK